MWTRVATKLLGPWSLVRQKTWIRGSSGFWMVRMRNLSFGARGNRHNIRSMHNLWPKECQMKTSILIVIVILSLLPAAVAQDQAGSNDEARRAGSAMSTKPLVVSGKVSLDGKSLLTDIDSEWVFSNPEVLKGHEGLRVTVKCYVDTGRSRIQILRVKKEESEIKYAARYNDSAFRR
jgi:hypothetical protein